MKKRKDSFWGLHFDFHANPKDLEQGKMLCEDDIREICTLLKPDFIQIDSKGHPGWTSFSSKLGNAVPDFKKDTLAMSDFSPETLRAFEDELGIDLDGKPKKLLLQPEGRALDFEYENGRAKVKIPRVDIHNVVGVCE